MFDWILSSFLNISKRNLPHFPMDMENTGGRFLIHFNPLSQVPNLLQIPPQYSHSTLAQIRHHPHMDGTVPPDLKSK